jgi:hypothetical protein
MITDEVKNLISQAKNIYVIPAENSEEAVPCALALFYTLKHLNKNVNIVIDNFPEKLNFLVPSLDFISYPRNFVISIPASVAEVSQVYYEKSEENLKIHLTLDKGTIKKDNISFYYADAKPDLIITLGIKDFRNELENKLNQFAFLMESDILNIDNSVQYNRNFGKINLIKDSSLSEIVLSLAKSILEPTNTISTNTEQVALNNTFISKESATCLLSALIIYTDNFKNNKTNSGVLESASILMKAGADREKIIAELYKANSQTKQQELISALFAKLAEQNLEINQENILKYLEN